jgi:hypothetical protein
MEARKMTTRKTETSERFTCEHRRCTNMGDVWDVEGRLNAEGEFEPTNHDDMGSDMDCPNCGERGKPTDEDLRVADL